MSKLNLKWLIPGILLLAAPLWAAERTGVLLPYTAPEKATEIKKEQDDAMMKLIGGNQYFVKHQTEHAANPSVMVVSCSDSHTPPESIFHMKTGELFVNRVFGNVVDKVILGSLEYGAQTLNCRVLVVMGHSGCTAIKGAIAEYRHARTSWVSMNQESLYNQIEPAVAEVENTQKHIKAKTDIELKGDDFDEAVVRVNILSTMRYIREQSPILWDLEHKDILKIVGCIYHKETGKVEWIKEQ